LALPTRDKCGLSKPVESALLTVPSGSLQCASVAGNASSTVLDCPEDELAHPTSLVRPATDAFRRRGACEDPAIDANMGSSGSAPNPPDSSKASVSNGFGTRSGDAVESATGTVSSDSVSIEHAVLGRVPWRRARHHGGHMHSSGQMLHSLKSLTGAFAA
jgi:hypothetical protein